MLSYNESACIKCNFPLEYMFTSAKWDNHTTFKNTVRPFPTTGSKADILTCEYSENAVSFPVPRLAQTVCGYPVHKVHKARKRQEEFEQ